MFKPKPYQQEALERLTAYLESARYDGAGKAFDEMEREVPTPWRKPYSPLDALAETPYVCLRLPTGGGKTYLATLAVKIAAQFRGRERNPLVLWLVPSDAIRQQTYETLTKPGHPNKETLEADFGEGRVRVLDVQDFADLTPQDLRDKACVVISTFAALRVEKTEGRKFYDHKEALEPHFAAVPPNAPGLEIHTEGPDKGKIKFSCANIMALIRPVVIVDEAHNHQTKTSYEVLNRVGAACVIEFTATPADDSNMLHHVSASVLKSEAMIKLPIMLTEYPSWAEALTDSILQRKKLESIARTEPDYIRPIVLIQAENKDKEVTVDVVKNHLISHGKIEEDRIAVATGTQRDLDGINLLDPSCKVEFVITVQALKEGWDCPFAYVFCSVATVRSPKDVEQLLGRVLRMPYAVRRKNEEMNRAYAFVSKASWPRAVELLHDRLVSMGFDEVEAEKYVQQEPPLFPSMVEQDPGPFMLTMREAPSLDDLAADLRSRIIVTRDQRTGGYALQVSGSIPPELEERILAVVPAEERSAVTYKLSSRRQKIQAPVEIKPDITPLRVPQLCLFRDGEWEPVQQEHFLSPESWSILNYPAELSEAEFRIEEHSDTYEIDVQGKKLVERHLKTQSYFDFDEVPTNWTDLQLSRVLAPSLRQKDIRHEKLLEFIRLTLRFLEVRRGIGLNTLYRLRAPLERALREKINQYRLRASVSGYQTSLFAPEAAIETSYDYSFAFDQENYPATLHYNGSFQFTKHLYPGLVGELENKEEVECAKAIEICPQVKRWVRNVRGLFGLPLASGTFYPDFIAELVDGRMLVVEYKGEHLIQYDQQKKNIGELWESKSHGKALFLWAVKKDEHGREVSQQLAAKVS